MTSNSRLFFAFSSSFICFRFFLLSSSSSASFSSPSFSGRLLFDFVSSSAPFFPPDFPTSRSLSPESSLLLSREVSRRSLDLSPRRRSFDLSRFLDPPSRSFTEEGRLVDSPVSSFPPSGDRLLRLSPSSSESESWRRRPDFSVSLSFLSPSSGFISFEPSALLLDDDDDEGSRVLGIVEE